MKTYEEKVEAIKKLVGTEFIYDSGDGLVIPAIVAAFDLEIGLTVLATHHIDESGEDHTKSADKNGNICVLSCNFKGVALYRIERIIDELYQDYYPSILSGRYTSDGNGGDPRCSF